MPRRFRPEKREVEPDLKYDNINVSMFINRLMKDGKKSTARRILYDAFDIIEARMNRPPIEVFEEALNNAMPNRRVSLGMRWMLAAARRRGGRSMAEKLAGELMDAANNTGAAVKRRDDAHRMAEANRAFAHYRF
jgi:small subunit ribosomal protein S7